MGFFDDFATGFAGTFSDAYLQSKKATDARLSEEAKTRAKAWQDAKAARDKTRQEDADRIAKYQALEAEIGAPAGSWTNMYTWDLNGSSYDKVRERAIELNQSNGWTAVAPAGASSVPPSTNPNQQVTTEPLPPAPANGQTSTDTAPAVTTTPVTGAKPQETTAVPPAASTPEEDVARQTREALGVTPPAAAATTANAPQISPVDGVTLTYTGFANNNGRTGDPAKDQNPEVVTALKTAASTIGVTNLGINSGFRGTDEHNHNGNAFDIDVSGWSNEKRIAMVDALSAQGFKGIGMGNGVIHADMTGDRPRIWWYDASGKDVTSMPDALSWTSDALQRHMGNGSTTATTWTPSSPAPNATAESGPSINATTPFMQRVQATIEQNRTDRVLRLLGVDEQTYRSGLTDGNGTPFRPTLKYTTAAEIKPYGSLNEAVISETMRSPEYLNAKTPAARLTVLQTALRKFSTTQANDPKEAAYQIMVASDEYNNADANGRVKLNEDFARRWASITSNSNPTAKTIAFNQFLESDLYKNSPDQPNALASWERIWGEMTRVGGTEEPMTVARLATMKSKYEIDLLSPDQATRERASAWLANDYPIYERNLISITAATNGNNEVSVRFTDANGQVRVTTGRPGTGEGKWIDVATGKQIENVISVQTPEDVKNATSALTAASGVYKPTLELRSSVVVAAHGAFELDRMAARQQAVLTATGAGVSLFEAGKTELRTLLELTASMGGDIQNTQESITAAINSRVDQMFNSGNTAIKTQDIANAYKEFMGATIRYIYASGKALGAGSGAAFSNKDYDNIARTILSSNSYEAFSNNLRTLTSSQMRNLDSTIDAMVANPQYADAKVRNPSEYFAEAERRSSDLFGTAIAEGRPSISTWASGRAGTILKYVDRVTPDMVASMPSLGGFEGRGVIIYQNGQIEVY